MLIQKGVRVISILKELHTSESGLEETEAGQRLEEFGYNNKSVNFSINMFAWDLVIVLLVLASLIFFIAASGWMPLLILLFTAIAGFLLELFAKSSMRSVEKKAALKVTVIRDGVKKELDSSYLVPGDVIELQEGDIAPAHLKNIKNTEKFRSGKKVNKYIKAVVLNTGTESIKLKTDTALHKKVRANGELFSVAVLLVCAAFFFISLSRFNGAVPDALMLAVALAVAAVPYGLSIFVTIYIASGMKRMLHHNVVLRNPNAVEKLANTKVICADISMVTYNEMTVREVYANDRLIEVTGHGYEPYGKFHGKSKNLGWLLTAAVLCNNSTLYKRYNHWDITGEPAEGALLALAAKGGVNPEASREKENPFTKERRMMSTVNNLDGKKYIFAKGAPEYLLQKCSGILVDGKKRKLTSKEKDNILHKTAQMGQKGLKVFGLACKQGTDENNLVFLGLTGMMDPVRSEAISAVEECKKAGIKVKLVTGDHKETALAVAKQLGLGQYALAEDTSKDAAEYVDVYARVSDKSKIVKALKGVAAKSEYADVRINHDMDIQDNNIASVVKAVTEAKGVVENTWNSMRYLFGSKSAVLLSVFIGNLLLPLHLLFMHLSTFFLPAGFKPRKSSGSFLTVIVMILGTLFVVNQGVSDYHAWSMALAALVLFQVFNAYNYSKPNKWLVSASLLSLAILFAALYPLHNFLQLASPGFMDWLMIVAVCALVIVVEEGRKLVKGQIS